MNDFDMLEEVMLENWWSLVEELGCVPSGLTYVHSTFPDSVGAKTLDEFMDAIRLSIHPEWTTVGIESAKHTMRHWAVRVYGWTPAQKERGDFESAEPWIVSTPLWLLGMEGT